MACLPISGYVQGKMRNRASDACKVDRVMTWADQGFPRGIDLHRNVRSKFLVAERGKDPAVGATLMMLSLIQSIFAGLTVAKKTK